MMEKRKGAAKIAEWKREQVKDIIKLAREWPVFGIVNMESLPAKQLLKIKSNLRETVVLRMVNKRMLILALDELSKEKENIGSVKEKIRGMPALIFTKEDPFKLYKTLKKSKSKAAAKAGQIAPNDITIKAGPTNFDPGPIIGELGRAGLKTKVENGKIAIANDKVIVKEGEVIQPFVADVLAKLGIEPMEIGLNLLLTYNKGEILTKDVLDIDEDAYIANIQKASFDAFGLAMEIGYVTKENIELLIAKAYRQAKGVNDKVTSGDLTVEEAAIDAVSTASSEEFFEKEKQAQEFLKEVTDKMINA